MQQLSYRSRLAYLIYGAAAAAAAGLNVLSLPRQQFHSLTFTREGERQDVGEREAVALLFAVYFIRLLQASYSPN